MDLQQATDYVIFLSLFCALNTDVIIQSLAHKGMDSKTIETVLAKARATIIGRRL